MFQTTCIKKLLVSTTGVCIALAVLFASQVADSTLANENKLSVKSTVSHPKSEIGFPLLRDDELRKVQREYIDSIQPVLKQYCADCHWGADAEADFNLEGFVTLDQLLNGRKKWKKAVVRMNAKEMPPEDSEPVPDKQHKLVLDWIDNLLNSVDCTTINPGRVTIRRLNATEYKNTIRDLVGIEYEPAEKFPGDDVGYGFDNIADVLSLPPILMEKYLQAAEEITTEAIVEPNKPVFAKRILGNQFKTSGSSAHQQTKHIFPTNDTVGHEVDIPVAGKYNVVVEAGASRAGDDLSLIHI